MSVFRRRHVFRDNLSTRPIGSASIVSATALAASILFSGTALGSTPGLSGDATGAIVIGAAAIPEITLEVSVPGAVVFAGAAQGVSVSRGFGSATIALGGIARCDAVGIGAITFSGSATVGSIFTMDAAGAITFAGTATVPDLASAASGEIAFSGTVGSGEITGGTVEVAASGQITWSGTALGGTFNTLVGLIEFSGTATAIRTTNYRTPQQRCYVVPRRDRRS